MTDLPQNAQYKDCMNTDQTCEDMAKDTIN